MLHGNLARPQLVEDAPQPLLRDFGELPAQQGELDRQPQVVDEDRFALEPIGLLTADVDPAGIDGPKNLAGTAGPVGFA